MAARTRVAGRERCSAVAGRRFDEHAWEENQLMTPDWRGTQAFRRASYLGMMRRLMRVASCRIQEFGCLLIMPQLLRIPERQWRCSDSVNIKESDSWYDR